MIIKLILTILPLIIPYMFLGENLCSLILAIISILFLLFNKKLVNANKILKSLLILMSILIIIIQIFISPYLESFSGAFIYVNMALYYIVFLNLLDKNTIQLILKYQVIAVTSLLIFFIVYEGFYYNIRISGNLMYSNSYALLLLITIYFNYIRKEDTLTDYIECILILGLLFTESRTTLILFILYLILKVINEIIIKGNSISLIGQILLPTIMALFQYIIYSNILMASIFIFPIFIYIHIYLKKLFIKIDYRAVLLALSSIIIVFIFSSNSMIERIKDISLKTGTLQERLIYFEDAISAIKTNPLGNGINMFKYKSYSTASAFYDVKYIHNSILQVAYDNGIIISILFMIFLIYGGIYILNHKHKNTLFLFIIYISIISHSLMDFDFSFSTISILLMFIIVLNKNIFEIQQNQNTDNYVYSSKKNISNKKIDISNKYKLNKISLNNGKLIILLCILLFTSYLTLFEAAISVGKIFAANNEYEKSNVAYNFASMISYGLDGRSYFNSAENFKNLDDLNESLVALNNSYEIYPFNPMIKWNMAYIYEEFGNDLKVIELRNELLNTEKYNKELYRLYKEYLNKKYDETQDSLYIDLLELLENKYTLAQKTINKRAKYIKNQIEF